jgi:hypothetical protein
MNAPCIASSSDESVEMLGLQSSSRLKSVQIGRPADFREDSSDLIKTRQIGSIPRAHPLSGSSASEGFDPGSKVDLKGRRTAGLAQHFKASLDDSPLI